MWWPRTNNFCKALRAHNTQNNDKGVKINPFTPNNIMHYAVIQNKSPYQPGHVTLENCICYCSITHSLYLFNTNLWLSHQWSSLSTPLLNVNVLSILIMIISTIVTLQCDSSNKTFNTQPILYAELKVCMPYWMQLPHKWFDCGFKNYHTLHIIP